MTRITEACTGCQSCRFTCPKQCISMTEDAEGFLVPHINEAVCTDCGLCAAHCPQNAKPAFHKVQKVLGARLKNDKVLSESASGGVFSGLAIKILNEYPGSAVFGCAFDEDLVARHICVTDITNIELLQSSKYVQSDINDTYLQVETLLKSGKAVFLSGTPCQIAGLYAYIRRDYDNLYTADLFCHGVPSPLLFKRYLERLGKLYGEKITFYDFRNKDKSGWGFRWRWRLGYGLQIKVQTKTKTKYRISATDQYFNAFLSCNTQRESCYACQYATGNRIADITLGDFWGIQTAHPPFYDRRGISCVLINTKKGERLIDKLCGEIEIIESDLDKASKEQYSLRAPNQRPLIRNTIYNDVNNREVDIFANTNFRINIGKLLFTYMKAIIPRFIKNGIKSSIENSP